MLSIINKKTIFDLNNPYDDGMGNNKDELSRNCLMDESCDTNNKNNEFIIEEVIQPSSSTVCNEVLYDHNYVVCDPTYATLEEVQHGAPPDVPNTTPKVSFW